MPSPPPPPHPHPHKKWTLRKESCIFLNLLQPYTNGALALWCLLTTVHHDPPISHYIQCISPRSRDPFKKLFVRSCFIILLAQIFICMIHSGNKFAPSTQLWPGAIVIFYARATYSRVPLLRGQIYHITYSTAVTAAKHKSGIELTKDTPYLALTCELWGVCSEDLG